MLQSTWNRTTLRSNRAPNTGMSIPRVCNCLRIALVAIVLNACKARDSGVSRRGEVIWSRVANAAAKSTVAVLWVGIASLRHKISLPSRIGMAPLGRILRTFRMLAVVGDRLRYGKCLLDNGHASGVLYSNRTHQQGQMTYPCYYILKDAPSSALNDQCIMNLHGPLFVRERIEVVVRQASRSIVNLQCGCCQG